MLRILHRFLFAALLTAAAVQAAAPITAAAFTPDGKQVVLGSQNGIEVRSWPELAAISNLATELAHVHDLSFSRDGKTLLAAGGAPAEYGAVEVFSWPEGKRLRRVANHDDVVYRVDWSPDGTQWASAGADGICHVVASETGKSVARFEGHSRAVLSLCYLPDGRTIASCGVDQTLQLWEASTGKHLRTLDNHVGTVNAVAARPGALDKSPAIVATISEDKTIRLWQPAIGRLIRFAKLASTPRTVAWSPAGDRLLVGCNDGHVRVLNAESLDVVNDLPGFDGLIHELLVDPERDRILVAGEAGCQAIKFAK